MLTYRNSYGQAARAFLLIATAATVNGCAVDHIRELREAEQTFSRAAQQENHARLTSLEALKSNSSDSAEAGGLVDAVTNDTGYRMAAEITARLMATKTAELRQDNLLCTAQTIRAFSLWRLGEGAMASQIAQLDCGDADKTPRDHALLRVVPALVKIDDAEARGRNGTTSADDLKSTLDSVDVALSELAKADGEVPRDHPIRAYLFMSRLAAIRVRHSAPVREEIRNPEAEARTMLLADETLTAYRMYLYCIVGVASDPEHESVVYWRTLFGDSTLGNNTVACVAS
jgi:hypothetical protein